MAIDNWVIRAALAIVALPPKGDRSARIVATLNTFAEPLVKLLRESKQHHRHNDDFWYCCPRCEHPDHPGTGRVHPPTDLCDCGADEWNKKVDVVLNG